MSQVVFSRRPYVVKYKDLKGEMQTIRRRPPPLLHKMLPTDIVELKTAKNEDYPAGEEYTVRHINPRHPNTIQIEDDDGNATFVSHQDLELEEMVAPRRGMHKGDVPSQNRYLLWP